MLTIKEMSTRFQVEKIHRKPKWKLTRDKYQQQPKKKINKLTMIFTLMAMSTSSSLSVRYIFFRFLRSLFSLTVPGQRTWNYSRTGSGVAHPKRIKSDRTSYISHSILVAVLLLRFLYFGAHATTIRAPENLLGPFLSAKPGKCTGARIRIGKGMHDSTFPVSRFDTESLLGYCRCFLPSRLVLRS